VIQKAAISDLSEILDIEKESYHKPWNEDLFMKALDSSDKTIFVSRTMGKISGYVVFEHVADEGHITNIAVAKSFRRKGIASELIGKAVTYARDLNVVSMFLEVRESNDAAKHLYNKFGFREIGKRKDYYSSPNDNAIIFQLKLGHK
jgi:[ribosomal protein S18]-alanine N-acetyltransferase